MAQTAEQNQEIAETVARERGRLADFIRWRVADAGDAEDILQDAFYELVAAARLMKPVEQAGAWLFRVVRNRIIDRGRKKRPTPVSAPRDDGDGGTRALEDLLPSAAAGPDAAYARSVLADELAAALDELPAAQREVFVAHELEARSFRELAAATGETENALRLRKHQAVLHLRRRLQSIHEELMTP